MIKEVFKLKKNAWYAKLIKKVWNLGPSDFPNMCPFFWLTVFTVLSLPFIAIVFLVIKMVHVLVNLFERYAYWVRERKYESSRKSDKKKQIKYDQVVEQLKKWYAEGQYDKIIKVKGFFGGYAYEFSSEERRKLYDFRYRKIEEREARTEMTKTQMMKMLNPFKRLISWVIYLSIFAGIVFLNLILWTATFSFPDITVFIGYALMIVSASILLVLAIWGLSKIAVKIGRFITNIVEKIHLGFLLRFFKKLFHYIWLPFNWFIKGLSLLGSVIYTLYKGNCPGIDWVDDEK